MKKLFLLMLLMPTFALAALGPDDDLIVLGERVGIVTKTTTLKELEEHFSKSGKSEQIKTYLVDVGEGELACQTEIYPQTPKQAKIIWKTSYDRLGLDESTRIADDSEQKKWDLKCREYVESTTIERVELLGNYSGVLNKRVPFSYHTADGLRSELNITQLNKLNGSPTRYTILCQCCGDNSLTFGKGKYSGYLYGYIEPQLSKKEEERVRKIFKRRYSVDGYIDDETKPNLPKSIEDKIILVGLQVYLEKNEYGY